MRDLILKRLEEILEESDGGLEDPFEVDFEVCITSMDQIKAFDDEKLLLFFEYTVGFQG